MMKTFNLCAYSHLHKTSYQLDYMDLKSPCHFISIYLKLRHKWLLSCPT